RREYLAGHHRPIVGRPAPHNGGEPLQHHHRRRRPEESIDALKRQSSPAAFTDDPQDSLGFTHLAYLPVLSDRRHLPPFAMWSAFPTSDYYGGSVTIGLAPIGVGRKGQNEQESTRSGKLRM